MAQYVYTMRRVGKTVPPKRAILKDISLSFFPGAKIGVLGLNGAGKSSLLRIMAGEDTQFDGEAEPMPNLRIGFLPQVKEKGGKRLTSREPRSICRTSLESRSRTASCHDPIRASTHGRAPSRFPGLPKECTTNPRGARRCIR